MKPDAGILIVLVVPAFVLLWIAVTALIAVAGGWYGLAQSHPVPGPLYEKGTRYSFQSLRLGLFANYNSSVHVTVYPSGIMLVPLFIFSILHKPIFIQFDIMDAPAFCRFIVHYATFSIEGRKIRIMGKSALRIKEHFSTKKL